jgi:hypothetical protein
MSTERLAFPGEGWGRHNCQRWVGRCAAIHEQPNGKVSVSETNKKDKIAI